MEESKENLTPSPSPKANIITLDEIQNFNGKYPKQLWYLFTIEMWERFCFYGMRGMLVIFMAGQLLLPESEAQLRYGSIQAFIYAFTFLGGIFADKILGFKRSLTFGAIMMIIGNMVIALSPHDYFYIGITLTVIGTGFFKPNVSSMVGDLYKKGDPRKEAGFSMFYSGINVGALLGGSLCVWLGKHVSWNSAFLAASIAMMLGLVIFEITKNKLGPIGSSPLKDMVPSKRLLRELGVYILALLCLPFIFIMIQNTAYTDIFMYIIGPAALLFFFYKVFQTKDTNARKKLLAALILILFSVVFFALFEQAGGSLALFAQNNLSDKVLGFIHIDPNVVNNGANSLFVIFFSPLLGIFWLWLNKRNKEPHTVLKFASSFIITGLAFYIFHTEIFFVDAAGKASLNIFVLAFFVLTIAELCISPIGLSMMTSLSPHNLSGMMMGLWFLGSAYGQYFAAQLGAKVVSSPDESASMMDKLVSYTNGYQQLAIYALIVGVFFFIVAPWVKKLMQEVK
ncbi:MAG: peptide MFS transporter [Dysgonomonas sp.]